MAHQDANVFVIEIKLYTPFVFDIKIPFFFCQGLSATATNFVTGRGQRIAVRIIGPFVRDNRLLHLLRFLNPSKVSKPLRESKHFMYSV